MALGILLCSVVPAATYAQDKLERLQEQPRIIVDHSVEAVTAALKTTAATSVAAGEVARGDVASRAVIHAQLLKMFATMFAVPSPPMPTNTVTSRT